MMYRRWTPEKYVLHRWLEAAGEESRQEFLFNARYHATLTIMAKLAVEAVRVLDEASETDADPENPDAVWRRTREAEQGLHMMQMAAVMGRGLHEQGPASPTR